MSPHRVDVVIPTRNRKHLVMGAIHDALRQEGVESRCIVVDDGSEDGTLAALEGLDEARLQVLHHGGQRGVSASRNTGIAATTAAWVAFLDDDDRWAPTKLASQLAAIEAEPGARWATTGCVTTDAVLNVTGAQALPGGGGPIFDRLLVDCFVPAGGSSVLASRSLLEEAGEFDVGLGAVEDWDFWIRLAVLAPIAYVHEPLVAYRRWTGNTSGDTALMHRYREQLKAQYAPQRLLDPRSARYDTSWRQWMARSALQDGRRVDAAREYLGIAMGSRSGGQFLYSLAALGAPRLALRRLADRDLLTEPEGWRDVADRWLHP